MTQAGICGCRFKIRTIFEDISPTFPLTTTKGQFGFIALKNELTSINSSEEDIRAEILEQMKPIWVLPDLDENELKVDNLMVHLHKYIYKEGMRLYTYDVNSNGEDKKVYTIEEGPKKETENEKYNYDRYLLINQDLLKIYS